MKKILITGAAGFIGHHLASDLIKEKFEIVGLDIINDYYDVNLKFKRLLINGIDARDININQQVQSTIFKNYRFVKIDISDSISLLNFMKNEKFDIVINLAAQAGVRYSIENPYVYLNSNVSGFLNILEACKHTNVKHLLYASTSSVYGINDSMPCNENENTDNPVSFYAATKKANEVFAASYSHLYGLHCTALRFFTVYGPWGRPDMALYLFADAIYNKKKIKIFNHGDMVRDFTYIDDIVMSIRLLLFEIIKSFHTNSNENLLKKKTPSHDIYNIGNSNPIKLLEYVTEIEKHMGLIAEKEFLDMQPGDVKATFADTSRLVRKINFRPSTKISIGVENFVKWFLNEKKQNNG